jgi:hypothetical protein
MTTRTAKTAKTAKTTKTAPRPIKAGPIAFALSRDETIALAARDWSSGLAYLGSGGDYRLKSAYFGPNRLAPWNKVARSFFVHCGALHDWAQRTPDERMWHLDVGLDPHPRPTARRAARAARLLWRWGRYIDPRSAYELVLRTIARDKTLLPWRGSR